MYAERKYGRPARKYTNKVLEAVNDGLLDPNVVLRDALNYMSESEVEDLVETNGYFNY